MNFPVRPDQAICGFEMNGPGGKDAGCLLRDISDHAIDELAGGEGQHEDFIGITVHGRVQVRWLDQDDGGAVQMGSETFCYSYPACVHRCGIEHDELMVITINACKCR